MASEPFNQNVYSSEPRPRVRKQTKSIKRKGERRKDVYKNVNVSFKMDLLIIHFVENQSMTNAHKFLLSTLLF